MADLSEPTVERRGFLVGSLLAAAALVHPTAPPLRFVTARAGSTRIGMADAEAITSTAEHYRRLGNRLGGGMIREQVVRFVHGEATRALHGDYTQDTGRALFSAVAQATRLAGSMAAEVGRHALAQRYYVQAFNLAMHADDRRYAAEVLTHASRLAVQNSQAAMDERDAHHNARHAVGLVRAAREVGAGATPVLTTQLHAVEARGLALLGDRAATTAAVDAALRAFDRTDPAREPAWLGYYSRTELYGELGQGLRDVGCPNRAVGMIEQALAGTDPWRTRSRAFAQTDLAMAYLAQGELEAAVSAAGTAVDIAEPVASQRIFDRLAVLRRRLPRHPRVAELDRRIGGLGTPVKTRWETSVR
ncbi:hypothetical protein [Actinokineospora sp. NBRC 105648]|uniref:hypothetical protein n=1 Tax=Actinokineospora sp. NBRC 105648 TaxID=3032206 RepID=UPI002553B8F1|nr:hypothetical protein [Actinokineospora sp. NBRC 105648]